jgi:hypothetical protein
MVSLPAETVLTSALASEEAEDSAALDSATVVVVASEAEEAAGVLEHEARPKQKEAATMTDISLRVKDFITKFSFLI